MKRFSKKEIFSIPNLMGYFRILMIPVFCYLYIGKQRYLGGLGGRSPVQSHRFVRWKDCQKI